MEIPYIFQKEEIRLNISIKDLKSFQNETLPEMIGLKNQCKILPHLYTYNEPPPKHSSPNIIVFTKVHVNFGLEFLKKYLKNSSRWKVYIEIGFSLKLYISNNTQYSSPQKCTFCLLEFTCNTL